MGKTLTGLFAATLLVMPLVSLAQVESAENSSGGSGEVYVMPRGGYSGWDGRIYEAPYPGTPGNSRGTICTQDAMQCPDGTWVGRSGPNCEFVCYSEAPYPGMPGNGYYEEAPYPGMPGNDGGGYIDWTPMWWNPFGGSILGEPGGYYYDGPAAEPPYWGGAIPPADDTICTQDAMQCPDGTWVGRTGPNCEFICGYEEAPYPGMPNPSSNWLGNFFDNFFNWLGF